MKTFLRVFGGVIAALWCVLVFADLGVGALPFTSNASGGVNLPAPSGGVALAVNGVAAANAWAATFTSPNSAGNSFGVKIQAGTNASDFTFDVINAANSKQYMIINGDGSGALGPSGTSGLTWSAAGIVSAATGLVSGGTTFTLGTGTGACTATSTLTGGAQAGSFLCTGTAGASTIVINLPTAAHGWSCYGGDITSGVAWAQVTPVATTSCKLTGTLTTTSDQVNFGAVGY